MNDFFEALDALYQSGDPERIEEYLKDRLGNLESAGSGRSGEYASVLNELASFYRGISRYDEAAALFEQALDILRGNELENTPQYATVQVNIAGLLRLKGQPQEAVAMFLEAKEILIQCGMRDGYAYRSMLNNLALAYQDAGNDADAFAAAFESFEGMSTGGSAEHEIATALNNLAVICLKMGRTDDAEKFIEDALHRYRRMPEENIHHAAALSTHGALLYRSGRYGEALASFQQSFELTERFFGKNIEYAMAARNIAMAYAMLGTSMQAVQYMLTAHTVLDRILGPDHPRTAECRMAAARLSAGESGR